MGPLELIRPKYPSREFDHSERLAHCQEPGPQTSVSLLWPPPTETPGVGPQSLDRVPRTLRTPAQSALRLLLRL